MSLKANRGVPQGQCYSDVSKSDYNNGFGEPIYTYQHSYYDD